MNSRAIADAIAARFVNVTATLPDGSTETLSATSLLPDMVTGPALIVFPPTGDVEYYPGRHRDSFIAYPVRMLRDPLGVARRTEYLYAWFDALYDKVGQSTTLGGLVTQALPVAVRLEIDGFAYAGKTLDVVELIVDVLVDEVVTSMAP